MVSALKRDTKFPTEYSHVRYPTKGIVESFSRQIFILTLVAKGSNEGSENRRIIQRPVLRNYKHEKSEKKYGFPCTWNLNSQTLPVTIFALIKLITNFQNIIF